MVELVAPICLILAALAAVLAVFNFFTLASAKPARANSISKKVAILIPFRNEINNVQASLASAKSQKLLTQYNIYALDDFSSDGTYKIINNETGITRVTAQELPNGWLGKLWASWQLAQKAEQDFQPDYLVFLDADVRLNQNAIAAAITEKPSWDFISPYPKQLTRGFIPFIFQPLLQWSWLSSIPLAIAHRFKIKSMIVANGQFLIVKKHAYFSVDGHRSVKNQVLDDLQLARKLTAANYLGGVINGSKISSCLMYESTADLFGGYRKSLWAGFGGIIGSLVAFLILFITGVLNFIYFSTNIFFTYSVIFILISRLLATLKTGSDFRSVIFHPLAIATLLYLFITSWIGKFQGTLTWRDRKLI